MRASKTRTHCKKHHENDNPCPSFTSDDYDKKLQELKDKQYRLNIELDEYTKADHEYHIHVNTVINLSRRIAAGFEPPKTQ